MVKLLSERTSGAPPVVFTFTLVVVRNGQHDIVESKSLRHQYGLVAFKAGQHVKRILETQASSASSNPSKSISYSKPRKGSLTFR